MRITAYAEMRLGYQLYSGFPRIDEENEHNLTEGAETDPLARPFSESEEDDL